MKTELFEDEVTYNKWSDEDAKRERVESLVSMIKKDPSPIRVTSSETFKVYQINGCKKRKFYQPQQQPQAQKRPRQDPHPRSEDLKDKVSEMELQLATLQKRLLQMIAPMEVTPFPADSIENSLGSYNISDEDWKCLAHTLKIGMSKLIDDWVKRNGPQTTPPPPPPAYYASFSPSDDDNLPISLVVSPKKRRCKVTDKAIRVQQSRPGNEEFPVSTYDVVPASLATSVAVTNPSLLFNYQSSRNERNEMCNSPDSSLYKTEASESDYGSSSSTATTLTPMHLRKAKLMFFYVRYPSSSVLKENFPDINFNKNNTAQLVKWFSNFREFYYIQMEKYARLALSEGIECSAEIAVSENSEIYRVLTQHYNRNTNIKVPPNFRYVVEQTLREFFDAISLGKNNDPSWKKVIYKVIARSDDQIPQFFKAAHFIDQLE